MDKLIVLILCVTLITVSECSLKQDKNTYVSVSDLKCEYLENPLGIDVTKPRLSWKLKSTIRGQIQTAYRILVASNEKNLEKNIGDLWDTGKVMSGQSIQVIYEGDILRSRMKCYWKVCAWGKNNIMTAFSAPSFWTMGLFLDSDWEGKWIAKVSKKPVYNDKKGTGPSPPYFRKTFVLDKTVRSANIYATARGIFELSINGKRVGKDIFAPEWTDYNKRIQYRTYDVSALLKDGRNAIGAILGEGWYSGYVGFLSERGHYGFQNSILLQLEIEYTDGSRQIISTDESWRCSEGPIQNSDMFMGENYDARREMPGWNTVNFDDNTWIAVDIVEKPDVPVVSQPSEPVQVVEYITPENVTEPLKGVYVFEMGQNMPGWVRLRVKGEAGTKVTMRFAERLNPDGTIYTENLRAAKATDTYILKGGEEEVYEPRFTFHGFQYVELTGFTDIPDRETITGVVIESNTSPAGTFECSNSMVNKIWRNSYWSQRDNFLSVPTDCPQRDERMGWMGDAQIYCRTATFNMDVAAFFTKWMIDVEDAQSSEGIFADTSPRYNLDYQDTPLEAAPGWADAGVIIPWTMYRTYGDVRIIEKHYDAMVRWMDFLMKTNPNLIRRNWVNHNYGDWLSIQADTPKDLFATAYWAYDAKLMSEMAKVIGRDEDAYSYDKLFQDIRSVFQENFVQPDGRVYPVKGLQDETGQIAIGHDVVKGRGETQTGYLLALYMDLLPEELRSKTASHLVEKIREKNWHLSTGFHGGRIINPMLSLMGYNEIAYRLLTNETFPSWGYTIKNGATTIWERWDGWTMEKGFQNPGMNSFNHYSFGAISEWLYRFVAGIDIDPTAPGYKRIVIRPYPNKDFEYARTSYNSIHGEIASGWVWNGDSFALDVKIPINTTATIYVPSDEGTPITEGNLPVEKAKCVTFLGYKNGYATFSVGSGTYHFMSTSKP